MATGTQNSPRKSQRDIAADEDGSRDHSSAQSPCPQGPLPALTLHQFQPIALNGLDDPANAYVHAMCWFKGCLYIGVTRFVYHALRPYGVGDVFEMFPVQMSTMPWDNDNRAQIWRFDPLRATWECVHISPWCKGSRGFQVPRHIGFRDMAVFQGTSDPEPVLYVTSWGSHMGLGPFVLRSTDGNSFTEVETDDRDIFGTQTLRALYTYRNKLFTITTGRDSGIGGGQEKGIVLVNPDPAGQPWKAACTPGFGDPRNVSLFDMVEFNDHLYASSMNPYTGYEIWKTRAEGEPPYKWTRVISDGAYRGPHNEIAISLCVFKGALYVGSAIYAGGYDKIYNIGPGSPELIRIHPDDSWDLIVGKPRETPDGFKVPASGLGPGFNNPFVGYIWRLCVHEDWLYAGTCVWSSWLPYTKRSSWPEHLQSIFTGKVEDDFMNNFGGFDLWQSQDGDHWQAVTNNGFGNRLNCGVRTMVSTSSGMFVGIVNQFGPKVAKKRLAGWRYEYGSRVGFEVWLGHKQALQQPVEIISPKTPTPSARFFARFKQNTKAEGDKTLLGEFYCDSRWRECGYWRGGIRNPEQACQNLMEEAIAFLRPDEPVKLPLVPTEDEIAAWLESRSESPYETSDAVTPVLFPVSRLVNLGCRTGASSNYLMRYFSAENITSIAASRSETKTCRKHWPGLNFEYGRLDKIKYPNNHFDAAIAIEDAFAHAKREKILAEVLRVLKPGGQIVGTELVPDQPGDPITAYDYRRVLERAGFDSVRVEDITEDSLKVLRNKFSLFLAEKMARDAIDEAGAERIRNMLPASHSSARIYVIFSGRKPA